MLFNKLTLLKLLFLEANHNGMRRQLDVSVELRNTVQLLIEREFGSDNLSLTYNGGAETGSTGGYLRHSSLQSVTDCDKCDCKTTQTCKAGLKQFVSRVAKQFTCCVPGLS